MKVLLLTLALVAVALCQSCSNVEGDWAVFQTGNFYPQALWSEDEIYSWGMDGDNKWHTFWHYSRQYDSINDQFETTSFYDYVTCHNRANYGDFSPSTAGQANPQYVNECGSCSLTTAKECPCYPYYDVAGSWVISPDPEANGSTDDPQAPSGWTSTYEAGKPPFGAGANDTALYFPTNLNQWNKQNCKQYRPEFIYYYTYRLRISSNGNFYKSFGIRRGFKPTTFNWEQFCDSQNNFLAASDVCYIPDYSGSDWVGSLKNVHYQVQSGEWRIDDSPDLTNPQMQFIHKSFATGCHFNTHYHNWPTAAYCNDDSGWVFGTGTTAHVRFGCDTGTFQDTTTDGFDIDDGDCSSIYLMWDEVNPLELTGEAYKTAATQSTPVIGAVSFFLPNSTVADTCWISSNNWEDHSHNPPSYRTRCSAGVLAVPFFALVSAFFMVLRNMF